MSNNVQVPIRSRDLATTFAALGDQRRLSILERLIGAESLSVSMLSVGMGVSRQAVSKHLKTLSDARLVSAKKSGRETLYSLERDRLEEARSFLTQVEQKWDDALGRLRVFVERDE